MKNIKKETKGITLLALTITIIILLILASVATYSGISVIKHSRLITFTTELKIMQTQVNALYDKWRNEEEVNGKNVLELGQEISSSDVQAQEAFLGAEIVEKTGYRYYNQSTIKELNIEGVDGEFLINIEKRSVVSYSGITYEGKMYYTLQQVPDGLYNIDYEENTGAPTFDATIKKIARGNWKIIISNIQYNGNIEKWEVKYKKQDEEYWSTQYGLEFIVNSSGPYNIVIQNGNVASEEKTVECVEVKVGDYVNYEPSVITATDSQITDLNKEINAYSGYSTEQSLSQEKLAWRVLEIDKATGNPTKLISAQPTTNSLVLYGANGYNNAVYVLNKACSTLYSGEYGDAISITIEDIEGKNAEHYSEEGKNARNEYNNGSGVTYGKLKRYISNSKYPKIAEQENKIGTNTNTYKDAEENEFNQTKTNGLNQSEQDKIYIGNTETDAENGITVTQTYYYLDNNITSLSNNLANAYVDNVYYQLFHGEMNLYWIASRCFYTDASSCNFDIHCAYSNALGASGIFDSKGGAMGYPRRLRPVVSLKSGVKADYAGAYEEDETYNIWNLSK